MKDSLRQTFDSRINAIFLVETLASWSQKKGETEFQVNCASVEAAGAELRNGGIWGHWFKLLFSNFLKICMHVNVCVCMHV